MSNISVLFNTAQCDASSVGKVRALHQSIQVRRANGGAVLAQGGINTAQAAIKTIAEVL